MALSHFFLNMALLCFLEWETNGSEESWERPDFEILLSDRMAAQREDWPIERLGILFIIPSGTWPEVAVSIQWVHVVSEPPKGQKSTLLRLQEYSLSWTKQVL